jgi:hypothetical protein
VLPLPAVALALSLPEGRRPGPARPPAKAPEPAPLTAG